MVDGAEWWVKQDVGGAGRHVRRNGGWSRMVHKFYFWLQLLGAFPPPYWRRDLIAVISLAVGRSMSLLRAEVLILLLSAQKAALAPPTPPRLDLASTLQEEHGLMRPDPQPRDRS